jgi:hemerythrin
MSPLTDFNRASNAETDREHQAQIQLLQDLCGAARENRDAAEVAEILAQVIAHSEAHFMSEELLMRLNSYDDFEDHAAAHMRILEVLQGLADEPPIGGSALHVGKAEKALDFVAAHIATQDQRLADKVLKSSASGLSPSEEFSVLGRDSSNQGTR